MRGGCWSGLGICGLGWNRFCEYSLEFLMTRGRGCWVEKTLTEIVVRRRRSVFVMFMGWGIAREVSSGGLGCRVLMESMKRYFRSEGYGLLMGP
jgi:hypothetical protein